LTADREVKGLWMIESNTPSINLGGHLLTIGKEGIDAYFKDSPIALGAGKITSSESSIVIHTQTHGSSDLNGSGNPIFHSLIISSVISDNRSHQVGLTITGNQPAGASGMVTLSGVSANTFTGDVVIEGVRNKLYLNKKNGVTAINGNIYVKSGAALILVGSDQISDSSSLTLSGKKSTLIFSGAVKDVEERMHSLVVESGKGLLSFGHSARNPSDQSEKILLLDDLIIKDGALLRIMRWQAGRDYLLVRKDSRYLEDALRKLSIDGWAKNQVYLKSYNKDYWSIEAAPEPATYGAILSVLGMVLAIWHRRRLER